MQSDRRRTLAVPTVLALAFVLALPAGPPEARAAEATLPDLIEYILLSPQPASKDTMNDEIPHVDVLGDDLVFCWETDYTHWPNPDGTSPVELPEDEDIQVRFMRDGVLSPLFNVSSDGVISTGYGHRSAMDVYDGKLYVYWNSHAWSDNGAFAVVLRVYDPATDTWDTPRTISDTPDGGLSAGADTAVHDGKLWFAWQGVAPQDPNSTDPNPGIEIYSRWFDGETWGPVERLSGGMPGQDTEPTVESSGGQLHVAWGHDDAVRPGNADIHHMTLLPGGGWSEMTERLGGGDDRNDKKTNLVDWNGTPVLLWQSDGISLQGQVYSDAMLSVWQGDRWGPARVINPLGRDAGNVVPTAIPFRERLYIAWATSDDGITVGTDLDVVIRDFDGERFGPIVSLSPYDTYVNDNPSDDGSVSLVVYRGNLYAVFDSIFSPVTDGPNKDVLLRYVGYDLDSDGHDDAFDAFPKDAEEWADSDSDGVGDNRDAYPNDRTRWEMEDGGEDGSGPAILAISAGVGAAIMVVLIVTALRRRRGMQKGDAPKS